MVPKFPDNMHPKPWQLLQGRLALVTLYYDLTLSRDDVGTTPNFFKYSRMPLLINPGIAKTNRAVHYQ